MKTLKQYTKEQEKKYPKLRKMINKIKKEKERKIKGI